MQKTKATLAKPGRKPLGELPISLNNSTAAPGGCIAGKWNLKPHTQEKKLPSDTKPVENDGGIDRLLLTQSDLSALAHQVRNIRLDLGSRVNNPNLVM